MKHYFLDTNILLDFLMNRPLFGQFALELFKKQLQKKYQLHTSDNCITTTYYILSKHTGEQFAREKTKRLLNYLEVQPVTKNVLQNAFQANFADYEDAVQHQCALSIPNLDAIITRNKRDYKNSLVPVFSPEEVIQNH